MRMARMHIWNALNRQSYLMRTEQMLDKEASKACSIHHELLRGPGIAQMYRD
jgi:hypothetical protein